MSEMVERVARALQKAWYEGPTGKEIRGIAPPWDLLDQFEHERWRLSAVTAVAAMQDPTEAMEYAAHKAAIQCTEKTSAEFVSDGKSWPVFLRPLVLWQAMIDEALR